MDRPALTTELEAAVLEQNRCMGGVDPAGCIAAARQVTALRNALRDNTAMQEHLSRVLLTPESVHKARPRPSPRSRLL